MRNSVLYKRITSDKEIYKTIYSIQRWMNEPRLLKKSDNKKNHDALIFAQLKDIFNKHVIDDTTRRVRSILEKVILGDEYFECEVYFRPKKVVEGKVKHRPLHTASIIHQVAIMTIMRALLYSSNNENIIYSEISKLIPDNFFGQLLSKKDEEFYEPWQSNYKDYTKLASKKYETYSGTGEYNSELTLDLVNFFPSVNPGAIYTKVTKYLSNRYVNEDYAIVKRVVYKLLYLKIRNFDNVKKHGFLEYYNYKEGVVGFYKDKEFYTVGLPQGLPHSYFFGNLIMLDVQEIYNKVLQEIDDIYYVDDSVIFANIDNEKDFDSKLKMINEELSKLSKKYDNNAIEMESEIREFVNDETLAYIHTRQKKILYEISIHTNGEKSYYEEIPLGGNNGLFNIGYINRQASLGLLDVYTTKSESEDVTIYLKFKSLKESILKEIDRVKNKPKYDIYLKKLKRLHKFFEFREIMIKNRSSENTQEELKNDILNTLKLLDEDDFEGFIVKADEFILLSKLNLLLDANNFNDGQFIKHVGNSIKRLFSNEVGRTYNYYWDYSYYHKILNYTNYVKRYDRYFSIRNLVENHLRDFTRSHTSLKVEFYKEIRNDLVKDGFVGIFNQFHEDDKRLEWIKGLIFGNFNTHEIYRIIINTVYSKIMNVDCNDSLRMHTKDSRKFNVYELKILIKLRSDDFNLQDFIAFLNELDFDNEYNANPSINEVINYFSTFVRKSSRICDLVDIHYLTEDIWRNGSKFLYFYTLHDQSHAIQLVKNVISIIKKIDLFQISSYDYYVIFASCYLHDVSMVFHPNLNDFLTDNGKKQAEMFENFKAIYITTMESYKNGELSLKKNANNQALRFFIDVFKDVDTYFENKIRINHHKLSADYIKTTSELHFLDKAYRSLVAEVSESHGAHLGEIYGRKSTAKKDKLSIKYLKILIRLADLLDLSKERMSYHFLMRNFEFMNSVSKFHHISHMITDGFDIVNEYTNTCDSTNDDSSFLDSGVIQERIVFKIYTTYSSLTPCKKVITCLASPTLRIEGDKDILDLEIEHKRCTKSCVIMCRWLNDKFSYLVQELDSLSTYLDNSRNYYNTKFIIRLEMVDDGKLNKSCQDLITKKYMT